MDINNALINEFKDEVQIITIPANRKPVAPWVLSVLGEWVCRKLAKLVELPLSLLSLAISRRSVLLVRQLKNVPKPDWVIGHNPGALWPTLLAGRRFRCRIGFDVEDYHPGEGNDISLQHLVRKLMTRTLSLFNYVSFAAPLIEAEVRKDVQPNRITGFTVPNFFPADEFLPPVPSAGKLKMVWFSQYINAGRGLEVVLPFIQKKETELELHLVGELDPDFFQEYLKNSKNLVVHQPVPQIQLHKQLAVYDIGLALDIAIDKNRDLAITNKLIAFLQAGLYVLANKTTAQQDFLQNHALHGTCRDLSDGLAEIAIDNLIAQKQEIRKTKRERFENFRPNNWETSAVKLLQTWNARSS